MSDQADRETMGDDLGVYSVDAEDQLQPEDTLDGEGDVLDRGYRLGDAYRGATGHGVTAEEMSRDETIYQRLRQEEPDRFYRDRDDSEVDDGWVGGSDTDAVRAQLNHYGGENPRVGRIVAPDEGLYPDREARLVASEGQGTTWDSPEESAMHYVDGDEEDEPSEVEWDPSDEVRGDDAEE